MGIFAKISKSGGNFTKNSRSSGNLCSHRTEQELFFGILHEIKTFLVYYTTGQELCGHLSLHQWCPLIEERTEIDIISRLSETKTCTRMRTHRHP